MICPESRNGEEMFRLETGYPVPMPTALAVNVRVEQRSAEGESIRWS